MESPLNLKRYTNNHTVNFLKFVFGLRGPVTSVSAAEHTLLANLAHERTTIIEVGVYEGATSRIFCREADPRGTVYLVDPFSPEVHLERLFNVSFTRWVATRAVQPRRDRVRFVREPSRNAAAALSSGGRADLIFIDARHDYDSVREDFQCWANLLAPGGTMAFHDSQVCAARPDLDEHVGPVRLMREVSEGRHGPWKIVGISDSVTAIRPALDVGGAP